MKDQFSALIARTLQQFLNEKLAAKFKSVLSAGTSLQATLAVAAVESPAGSSSPLADPKDQEKGIMTTVEETEGFLIARAILRKNVPVNRVVMRDVQSYCGILLDDNNRKPIGRMHFNGAKKYLTLFDGPERHDIESLDDLYQLAPRLRATVVKYETKPAD